MLVCCGCLLSQLVSTSVSRIGISSVFFLISRISVAEVEFRDIVSILSVVKPSRVTDTSNEIETR